MPNTEVIPTADVAELLQVHVRTVHRLVRKGTLTPLAKAPGLRGALLFDRQTVIAYAQAQGAA